MNTNLAVFDYRKYTEFLSNNEYHSVLTDLEHSLQNCKSFLISVAFITEGGITPLLQVLKELEKKDIKGQILTTDYLTFSEPRALEKLNGLKNITLKMFITDGPGSNNKVGFHTKGYIFEDKNDDCFTIIIGSSNLTNRAITCNKEWNTKVYVKRDDEFTNNVLKEFHDYWNEALYYDDYKAIYNEKYKIVKAQKEAAHSQTKNLISKQTYELKPNHMQVCFINSLKEKILEGAKRALLISATGTGKTYASAFALRELNVKKALFVVHREQIASQARDSFNIVFNGRIKTCIFSGSHKNFEEIKISDYVFATVQTLSKPENLALFTKDEFETIVIDEAHHAVADSYSRIMSYFEPNLFLGMTATPDRTDKRFSENNVYKLFDNVIAYEIRLQDALRYDFLCPFHYFGIHDFEIHGKDNTSLEDFTDVEFTDKANYVIEQIRYYSYNGPKVKGLVFCNNLEEAEKYSNYFNEHTEFKTCFLNGADNQETRKGSVQELDKSLDYIFTVDIFNEGIDIPSINQVVLLRKTQSSIVFIQQLGRGLRKHRNKEFVVVLDFVGNYENNYNIPLALTGDKTYKKDQLRKFIHAPNNYALGESTIHFDEISKSKIFKSIDTANFKQKQFLKENYLELKNKLGRVPSLIDFYKYGSMDLQCIFGNRNYQSYYTFLKAIKENDYKIVLNDEEEQYLQFVSSRFGNDKRLDEVLILEDILEGNYDNLFERLENKISCKLKEYQKKSLFNILSGKFVTGTAASKVKDIIFVELQSDEKQLEIKVSQQFLKLLENKDFFDSIKETLEYSKFIFNNLFPNVLYKEDPFVFYSMYSYDDVCRLLYWETSLVPLNIGGYRYDAKTNTMPIFINYNKSENISNSTRYEDEFLDKETLTWFTKSNRNINSKEVNILQNLKKNGIKVPLFVRKNNSSLSLNNDKKNQDSAKEFYYLGLVNYVDCVEESTMLDNEQKTVSVVKMRFHLKNEVRDDIFEYITIPKILRNNLLIYKSYFS